MNYKVSDGEKYQKIMEVEISTEELAFAMHQAAKRLAARINIPGFRKGKAPLSIIENYVGPEALLSEAADEVVPQAYVKGLKELELKPVEQPKMDIVQLAVGEPLIFTAAFIAKPQVMLGQYKGLPITKQIHVVSSAEIEADIETQRRRLSRLVEAEEGTEAAIKDVLSISFEGFLNGLPFEGGKAEKYPLELGANNFVPGFEEQLIGIKAGEEREINVVFPENYQDEALAGQPVLFKVKALGLKRRVWPELDDEFAQEVSETAETLEDLRREVCERLQKAANEEADNQAREYTLSRATDNAIIDVPPLMIEQRVDSMIQNLTERLQEQGGKMEQFLAYNGRTMEELRENYLSPAEKAVRCDLMLEAVSKAENISVSDEELEQQLQMLAGYYQQKPEQLRKTLVDNNRLEALIDDMRINKAVSLICDSAEISEVETGAETPVYEIEDY